MWRTSTVCAENHHLSFRGYVMNHILRLYCVSMIGEKCFFTSPFVNVDLEVDDDRNITREDGVRISRGIERCCWYRKQAAVEHYMV